MQRFELITVLEKLLQPSTFKDYCPNGLQVEGRSHISKIVTGVTASAALIEKAIAVKADTIIVHHGLFWRGDDVCCVGMLRQRLRSLLTQDINLLAYHLPLDCHTTLGNNVQLAQVCGWRVEESLEESGTPNLFWYGALPDTVSADQLADQLQVSLGRRPEYFGPENKRITRIAWCTGAAQKMILKAADLGVDAFITGEASEASFHMANELGVSFFAAGHHATERYGVKALGQYLQSQYGVECEFIDLHNPV